MLGVLKVFNTFKYLVFKAYLHIADMETHSQNIVTIKQVKRRLVSGS